MEQMKTYTQIRVMHWHKNNNISNSNNNNNNKFSGLYTIIQILQGIQNETSIYKEYIKANYFHCVIMQKLINQSISL